MVQHACLCSVISDSLQPSGLEPTTLLCPWDFPGKNTGVGCHFLFHKVQHGLPVNYCYQYSSSSTFDRVRGYHKFRAAPSFLCSFSLREICNAVNYGIFWSHSTLPLSETNTFTLQLFGYISYAFHSLWLGCPWSLSSFSNIVVCYRPVALAPHVYSKEMQIVSPTPKLTE